MAIGTALADSLNPMALTQQFLLQGLVKKPRHIWFYILAVGLTNLAGGLLVYGGLSAVLQPVMDRVTGSPYLPATGVIGGILLLVWAACLMQNRKWNRLRRDLTLHEGNIPEAEEEKQVAARIRSVHPAFLFFLGIAGALSELPTALPYFAFLAALLQQGPSFPAVVWLLVLYNLLYCVPLMLLYGLYRRFQDRIDRIYLFIKEKMVRLVGWLLPAILAAAGLILLYRCLVPLYR